jgi:glutamate synthase (NADPH/NADH) large chain
MLSHSAANVKHLGYNDERLLRLLIHKHYHFTGSKQALAVLNDWENFLTKFVKVMPKEYRRALKEMAEARAA